MANRSFMEMIFEDALASGLARELARAERPPPENFFLLPSDVKAWREIQVASKNENMVICLEITRNGNEKCKMVQSIFMDMARKFENVPFLRVSIQPFATFDEVLVCSIYIYIYMGVRCTYHIGITPISKWSTKNPRDISVKNHFAAS